MPETPTRRRFGRGFKFEKDGSRWVVPPSFMPDAYIERRKAEPGCESGWYVFSPYARDGVFGGDYVEHAAELIGSHVERWFAERRADTPTT